MAQHQKKVHNMDVDDEGKRLINIRQSAFHCTLCSFQVYTIYPSIYLSVEKKDLSTSDNLHFIVHSAPFRFTLSIYLSIYPSIYLSIEEKTYQY